MTEVFLVAPARTATVHVASYLQIAVAEVRIKAVTGLMITIETHAGTVSLRPPNSPRESRAREPLELGGATVPVVPT